MVEVGPRALLAAVVAAVLAKNFLFYGLLGHELPAEREARLMLERQDLDQTGEPTQPDVLPAHAPPEFVGVLGALLALGPGAWIVGLFVAILAKNFVYYGLLGRELPAEREAREALERGEVPTAAGEAPREETAAERAERERAQAEEAAKETPYEPPEGVDGAERPW